MNRSKKYILQFALSLLILFLVLSVSTPYFFSSFLDLRHKKEDQENYQKFLIQKEAEDAAKRKQEQKNYLLGKFNPAVKEDFVLIPEEYILYEEGKGKMYLRKEAFEAYLKMQAAARGSSVDLKIVSAARNFDYQKDIWEKKWSGATLVDGKNLSESVPDGIERFRKILEYSAVPGASRHHWGTEIDLNGVNPPYFRSEKGKKEYAWLVENAEIFGFCQTYNEKDGSQTGPPATLSLARRAGYNEEKWH